MRSVEQQLQAAIAMASPLSPLELSLRESRGCVVASDVLATYPIPSFDAVAHHGYAVLAESISSATEGSPTRLRVVDSVAVGFASDVEVGPGQAVRVTAGALMPKGADTVIPLASTRRFDDAGSGQAEFAEAKRTEEPADDAAAEDSVEPGNSAGVESAGVDGVDVQRAEAGGVDGSQDAESPDHVVAESPVAAVPAKDGRSRRLRRRDKGARASVKVPDASGAPDEWIDVVRSEVQGIGVVRAGSQRAAGAHLLAAGSRLGDRELATVAAGGHARVPVHPEPRVVIVTVGDELVDTTRALTVGLVHDTVAVMLMAASEQVGATAFRGGPSRRDVNALARTVEDQLVRADLIVVVGEDDSEADPHGGLVAAALKQAGCEDLEYCQVEPGPAIGLGTVGEDGIAVITVGRTALSAFVGFEVLVRPTIAALAGRQTLFRPVVRAGLSGAITGTAGSREFRPAFVRLDAQGSRALVSPLDEPADQAALWLHRANALLILPEESSSKADGDEVAVIRLDRE